MGRTFSGGARKGKQNTWTSIHQSTGARQDGAVVRKRNIGKDSTDSGIETRIDPEGSPGTRRIWPKSIFKEGGNVRGKSPRSGSRYRRPHKPLEKL